MILGVGTDIVEISRIENAIQNERFLLRIFTAPELKWLSGKSAQHYAGMFAAKEAAAKAGGGYLADYQIDHEPSGKPIIITYKPGTFHLSISHCKEYATAVVVHAETSSPSRPLHHQP